MEPKNPLCFYIISNEGKSYDVLLNLSIGVEDGKLLFDRAPALLLQFWQLVHRLEVLCEENVDIFVLKDQQSEVKEQPAFTLLVDCDVVDCGVGDSTFLGDYVVGERFLAEL